MALPVDNQESLLQELDFNRILGAPLSACVNAQEEAAQATLQYLNEVVFTQAGDDDSSLEPVTVSFYFESGGQVHRIVMPLLLIVPVPYLQIDRVDLTFQGHREPDESRHKETLSESQILCAWRLCRSEQRDESRVYEQTLHRHQPQRYFSRYADGHLEAPRNFQQPTRGGEARRARSAARADTNREAKARRATY